MLSCEQKKIWHFVKGDLHVDTTFQIMNVESTNLCQLNCKGCPRNLMTRPEGFMSEQLFKILVKMITEETSTEFVWLHHMGDPLLHARIIEFASIAKQKGLNTGISIKGHNLTRKKASSLARSELSEVLFCFDGTTPEAFNSFQRGANYKLTMRNMEYFLSLKRSPLSGIQLLIDKETSKDGIEKFEETWVGKADYFKVKMLRPWIGDSEEINRLLSYESYNRHSPCYSLWKGNSVSVLWNGDIVPCCHDYDGMYVLGNILEEPLKSIWNNERMQRLRGMHLLGESHQIPLCRNCPMSWSRTRATLKLLKSFVR